MFIQTFFELTKKKQKSSSAENRRPYIVNEIIETEIEYVKSLSYLLTNYLSNIQDLISPMDLNNIFSNIIWIYNINSEFEKELLKTRNNENYLSDMINIFEKYVK